MTPSIPAGPLPGRVALFYRRPSCQHVWAAWVLPQGTAGPSYRQVDGLG